MKLMRLTLASALLSGSGCSLFTANDLDAIRKTRDAGGTAQLLSDRQALDFGLAPVGQPSVATIALRNIGTAPTGTFAAALSGSGAMLFAVGTTTQCENVAAGSDCELTVTYTASSTQVEAATLTLTATPGGVIALPLSGEGFVPGALRVTPSLIDFGSVVQGGQSAAVEFVVQNVGVGATGALDTSIVGGDALQFEITTDTCAAAILQPNGSCTVTARFAPGLPGPRRATLRVSGAPGGIAIATLVGTGVQGGGQLAISPSSRTFAAVPAGSVGAAVTFRITNNGTAASGAPVLQLTGSAQNEYQLGTTDCSAALPPTGTCMVQVRFQPTTPGPKVATLQVTADPGGSATASLGGVADVPAAISAMPPAVDFGTVLTAAPGTASVTITNTGARPTGALTSTLEQDAGVFVLVGACNMVLQPMQNCQVNVRFTPNAVGVRTATLVVQGNPGGVVNVPLTGDGATPGALTIAPTPWDFGPAPVGSTSMPRTFTVTNTGTTDTESGLSVSLSGTNLDQFNLPTNQCTGVLGALASCDVVVEFRPTSGLSKSASLSVTAADAGTAVAQLNGSGQTVARLRLNPAMTDFMSGAGATRTFDVFNDGDLPTTAPLNAVITGNDASQFSVTGNGCGTATLAGAMSCQISVRFAAGGTPGVKNATLEVQPASGPGGLVTSTLQGTSLAPSALNFDQPNFGSAFYGGPAVQRAFTLTNDGGITSGGTSFVIGGLNANEFTILPPSGSDCRDGGVPGGSSCTVRVSWTATAMGGRGARSADLTVSATPGGPATTALNANGLQPATLNTSQTSINFGPTELGTQSSTEAWLLSNIGDGTSGTPMFNLSGSNASEFSFSGCGAPLDAGASCMVNVSMTPTGAGVRTATLRIQATPGGPPHNLALAGTGRAVITLIKTDAGAGRVWSDGLAIDCGPTCLQQTANFDTGGFVTLHARTNNGVSAVFNGWADGGCSAAYSNRDCVLSVGTNDTVRAQFGSRDHNLFFVSDITVPNNLGALQNYDWLCNYMALDAGINNLADGGTAYIAVKTTDGGSFLSRLGGARGFIRMDGRPVSDTQAQLFTGVVMNPLSLDQFGARHVTEVGTGVEGDGSSDPIQNCNNWSTESSGASFRFGVSTAGPFAWVRWDYQNCDVRAHMYCVMNIRTATPLSFVSFPGKRMWLTNTSYIPSTTQTPNQKCMTSRPAGVATAKALVGYVDGGVAPSAALAPNTLYIRPDGQRIGTYDELVNTLELQTGIWQNNLLVYEEASAWLAAGDPNPLTSPPPAGVTCNDWTTSSGAVFGSGGTEFVTDLRWLGDFTNPCNDANTRLVCVEQ